MKTPTEIIAYAIQVHCGPSVDAVNMIMRELPRYGYQIVQLGDGGDMVNVKVGEA